MIEQITAEVAVIGVNRTDKGCFVRLEIHSPDELEPFFLAKGGQYMAVFQRISEEEKIVQKTGDKPQRMSVLAYKLCESLRFTDFVRTETEPYFGPTTVDYLKWHLGISKRAELDDLENKAAREKFSELLRSQNWFQE